MDRIDSEAIKKWKPIQLILAISIIAIIIIIIVIIILMLLFLWTGLILKL